MERISLEHLDVTGTYPVGQVEERPEAPSRVPAEIVERAVATFTAYRVVLSDYRDDPYPYPLPQGPGVPLLDPRRGRPAPPARAAGAARGRGRRRPAGHGHRPAARRAAGDERHPVAAGHRGGAHPLVAQLTWSRAAPGGTPATVALTRAGIAFTLHEYDHDPPRRRSYGLEAAEALGLDPDQVFKTLLADLDGALVVAVVPVSGRLDLKALARALGGSRAAMADPKAAERATGYVTGGISPVGQKRRAPHGRRRERAGCTTRCTCRRAGAGWTWGSPRPTWWR